MTTSDVGALSAVDLIKTYPGGRNKPSVRALDGLSLAVETGTVFGLLGPNGAGKSTTVKILATLARPDSGSAFVGGVDVLRHPDRVRRVIGLVSQKASSDPLATGRENLVLAGRIQGLSRAGAGRRATELLARFALGDAADRLARTYSGGMARKLDVAIGLVHRPQVLFLDEPTTGLDPEARAELWAEIARLAEKDQMSVLLTTHYLEEADRLAGRLALVDAGRVVVEGTAEELKSALRGDTVTVGLRRSEDVPAALTLLDRLPGVHGLNPDGRSVRASADDGAVAVPVLLTALDGAGIEVASVALTRPSLDDVYLRHVGRSLEVAA